MINHKIKTLYPFKNSSYQTFLQDLADCLIKAGYERVDGFNIPWEIRLGIAKYKMSRNISFLSRNTNPLIVLGAGYIDSFAFPYSYSHEIIPILWDTWPRYWNRLIKSFSRHHIRLAFFTQSVVAQYVKDILPNIKCVHLPEALASEKYKKGKLLVNRHIDILELGRSYQRFHSSLIHFPAKYNHLFQRDQKLIFNTTKDLTDGLANTKLTICFPRCMTHPEHAGNVETLTQRYWECMFSRSLVVGHAPAELTSLLGYNPVIEVDWTDPKGQILHILQNIGDYQDIVDKNYLFAQKFGTWDSRIQLISKYLNEY